MEESGIKYGRREETGRKRRGEERRGCGGVNVVHVTQSG